MTESREAVTSRRKKHKPLRSGDELILFVCRKCNYVEGEQPQAGCCGHCGSSDAPRKFSAHVAVKALQ